MLSHLVFRDHFYVVRMENNIYNDQCISLEVQEDSSRNMGCTWFILVCKLVVKLGPEEKASKPLTYTLLVLYHTYGLHDILTVIQD